MKRRNFLVLSAAAPLAQVFMGAAGAQEGDAAPRFKIGVIGDTNDGGYGHNMHQTFNIFDDMVTVGIADPVEKDLLRRADECYAENTYSDYREMLAKEKPDIVIVAPRATERHLEYLLACAEIGAHGMLEKPLTPDLAEADKAIAALDTKNLKWSIGFNFRASAVTRHLRKMVMEEGLIGEVLEVRARGKQDHRAGGEDLIVLGIHIFDLMNYFLGKPEWCTSDIRVGGRPATPADVHPASERLGPIVGDRISAMFGFKNGIPATFTTAKNNEGMSDAWGMEIYGTKGVVSIRMRPVPEINLWRTNSYATKEGDTGWEPIPGAPEVILEASRGNVYDPIVTDLVDAIEKDRKPMVSLHDARNAHEMIQAVWESHVSGSRVTFPLEKRDHPLKRWA